MIRFIAAVFVVFLSIPLFSEPLILPEGIDHEDLIISKETWNIGLSSFSGSNLNTRYEYLQNALPLLVQEEISNLGGHILSEEEISHLRTNYIKKKTVALAREKSSLHAQRDGLLFSELHKDERELKYKDYSQQIETKQKLLDFWSELDTENIQISETLPVLLKKYTDSEAYLTAPRAQIRRFMESEDIDLMITGTVERLDDMFYLDIEGKMQYSDDSVFSLSKIVAEEELDTLVSEGAVSLRTLILGRSWSELSISAVPDNALILINGETRAVGAIDIADLEPGFITLSVVSSGYKSDIRQLYLTPGEFRSLEVELEKGQGAPLAIFSNPPAADVYFGATWIGQTPLYTEIPPNQSKIKISKDDFMPFYADSNTIEGGSLTVQLGADLFDKQKELKISKKKFYKSLGWFSMSVAVPLVLSGVYQNLNNRYYNYAVDYNSSGDPDLYDKAVEFQRKSDIAYYSLWGGIAVSSGLLVNTIFKLRDYIRAAERSTED